MAGCPGALGGAGWWHCGVITSDLGDKFTLLPEKSSAKGGVCLFLHLWAIYICAYIHIYIKKNQPIYKVCGFQYQAVLSRCTRALRLCTCLWMFTHKRNCDGMNLCEHLPYRQCSRRKGKSLILSETHCGTKRLEGGPSEAISSILCFDLLPMWRSNHLTVIVYQAATVLFSSAVLVRIFLNHVLWGEILTCLDQGIVYWLVHLPGRFVLSTGSAQRWT